MYIAYDHDSESHKYIHMYVQYTWIAPITCRPTNLRHNNEIILTNVAQYNLTLQIRFFFFSFSGTCTFFNHRFKINTLNSLSTDLHVLSFSFNNPCFSLFQGDSKWTYQQSWLFTEYTKLPLCLHPSVGHLFSTIFATLTFDMLGVNPAVLFCKYWQMSNPIIF